MIKINLLVLCMITAAVASSQVGINTTTPNTNAALDISALNNKGLLIPRGDVATRAALNSNTAKGLFLYDTVTNSLWIHNGNGQESGWQNQVKTNRTFVYYSASNSNLLIQPDGTPSNILIIGSPGSSYYPFPGPPSATSFGIISFLLPANAIVRSINMYYHFNNDAGYVVAPVLQAQLYASDVSAGGANTFVIVPGAQASLTLPTNVLSGTYAIAESNLSVPLVAKSRIMLGVTMSGPPNVTISGNMNITLEIEY